MRQIKTLRVWWKTGVCFQKVEHRLARCVNAVCYKKWLSWGNGEKRVLQNNGHSAQSHI